MRYYSKFPWAIPYLRVGSHALLTRLPLPRRGVRLACVRPAASVRSEPGSNSQVESLDSGRLGGITPRIFCVTGTFTLIHSDFSACIMVMAETQLSPESVLDHEPIFQSSGSARTPPSAFPFLQNHLSKSKTATKTAHRPQSDRLQRQRRSTLGIPGGNHVLSERAMPVTGRRSTECLATRIELISSRPACQRSPCKKFTVAQFSYV